MNNKGFAVTGIIYSVLLIFLVMMTTMLFNLQNRKTILDELKLDAVDAVESENNYDYLLSEINALKAQIGDTDISGVGDGTITGTISEISHSSSQFTEFQEGQTTTDAVSTSTWTAFEVTFDEEFSEVPNVICSPFDGIATQMYIMIKTITTTGFTGRIWAAGYSTAHSLTVNWIAFN